VARCTGKMHASGLDSAHQQPQPYVLKASFVACFEMVLGLFLRTDDFYPFMEINCLVGLLQCEDDSLSNCSSVRVSRLNRL